MLFSAQLDGSVDSVRGKVNTSAISTTSRTEQLSLGFFISLVDHSVVSNGVVGCTLSPILTALYHALCHVHQQVNDG